MKGSVGETPDDLPAAVTAATPSALCLRLDRQLQDWNRFVRSAQSEGILSRDGEPVAPPASPGNEVRVTGALSGAAAQCDVAVRKMNAEMNWKIARAVVSRNPKWGVVWRGDAVSPKYPNTPFRDVCWVRPGHAGSISMSTQPLEMFDLAQSVAPLAPE
jgi:hypothetical protein